MNARLIDVTGRDGLQDEPVFVATADKVAIARALIEAGVTSIETTSFVHPKWVPQLADAEALVVALPHGPRYSALIMNARGLDRAVAAFRAAGFADGSWDAVFVTSASERHALANNNRTVDDTLAIFDEIALAARTAYAGVTMRAALACSFVSPWSDEAIESGRVVEIARRLVSGGIRELTLADTVGAADPRTVGERVARVANELPNVPLSLHVHDTAGYGLANVYAASTAGVATFEGALAGLGGCPFAPGATGNLDLVKMARFLTRCGATLDVDIDALERAAHVVREAVGRGTPLSAPLAHAH